MQVGSRWAPYARSARRAVDDDRTMSTPARKGSVLDAVRRRMAYSVSSSAGPGLGEAVRPLCVVVKGELLHGEDPTRVVVPRAWRTRRCVAVPSWLSPSSPTVGCRCAVGGRGAAASPPAVQW